MEKTLKSLEDLYQAIVITESEKLTGKNNKVGSKDLDLDGAKKKAKGAGPEAVKGIDKPKELKHQEDAEPKPMKGFKESAFERVFKSALYEDDNRFDFAAKTSEDEDSDEEEIPSEEEAPEVEGDNEEEEEEGLLSRLNTLRDEIDSIIASLSDDEESEEGSEEDESTDDEVEEEFGPEPGEEKLNGESIVSEAAKSKLEGKNNKVGGKLGKASKGKAVAGKNSGKPLKDGKGKLQSKKNEVKSNIKKGADFIK